MINYSIKEVLFYSMLFLLGAICFLIYLFYRPEEIILNKYFYITLPSLHDFKSNLNNSIPLNNFIIYNLPAGIWVLSLSLIFKNINIRMLKRWFRLCTIPLAIGIIIELMHYIFQLKNRIQNYLDYCQ